ncbi:MAG: mandelate racemase/muconate lactonizing enzyme family protein [Chloroflexi bacterium]|nr:mandelate racemase/muconate lactonizing enzyme family protein [Chloroflexota bacterium]
MRITDVTTLKLAYDCPEPMADAVHYISARRALIVQVHTDEGYVGLGEAGGFGGSAESVEAIILQDLRPKLLGQDPFNTERLWQMMYIPHVQRGRHGLHSMAIAGVDVALWDIVGQATGLPLYKLLGGYRDELMAYASGGFYSESRTPQRLAEEMAGYAEAGFRFVKMKVGRDPSTLLHPLPLTPPADFANSTLEQDVERVRLVRQAIGPRVGLAVDANSVWTPSQAIKMGREFQRFDVAWLEEPVPNQDVSGSAEVARALDLPVAGYEQTNGLYGFRELAERRAVDIVQPDVIWAGGITECRKIAALAAAYHLPCMPHVFSSGLSLVANLHFVASLPNGQLLEFDRNPNPLRDELFEEPLTLDNRGLVRLPQRPGLGVRLNEATVAKYRVA